MTKSPGPVADTHDLIRVQGARENNLKDVSIDIPKRRLSVFTGVSGSGKSSLVFGTIAAESQRMILIGDHVVDLGPGAGTAGGEVVGDLHRSSRSDPQRVCEGQRRQARPVQRQLRGRLPTCNGAGVIYTDLAMMSGVSTVCEDCEGKRFQASVLEYRLAGRNIAEVLDLPVGASTWRHLSAG